MKKFIPAAAALFVCTWIPSAMAYIDPGSGSAIMSAIIGFFVAVGLAVKTYWYKIKSMFRGKQEPEQKPQGEEDVEKTPVD